MHHRFSHIFKSAGVLGTSVRVLAVTLAVKLVDIAKNILSVSRFGVTAQADVYNVIISIPEVLVVVVGMDTLRGAATTYFTEFTANDDTDGVRALLSSLLTWGMLAAAVLLVFGWLFMAQIMGVFAAGFDPDKLAMTIALGYVILPVLMFRSLVGILLAALNARNVFAGVTLLAVIPSIAVGVTLLLSPSSVLARNAAWAFATGYGAYVVALAVWTRRHVPWGFSLRTTPAFRAVVRFSGQLAASMIIAQIAGVVERRSASYFPDGTVAALGYASALASQFVFLAVLSLFSVMQRRLTERYVQGGAVGAVDELWTMVAHVMYPVVFCVVCLVLLRAPILTILYARLSFDQLALARTAEPMVPYGLWILGQAMALTATTFLLSVKRPRVILLASVIAYGTEMCLVGVVARAVGPTGIAWCAMGTIGLYATLLLGGIGKMCGFRSLLHLGRTVRIGFAGVAAAAGMVLVQQWIGAALPRLFDHALVQCAIVAAIGLAVYVASSSLLGVNLALSVGRRVFAGRSARG